MLKGLKIVTAIVVSLGVFYPNASASQTLEERYGHLGGRDNVVIRGNSCFSRMTGLQTECRHVCEYEDKLYTYTFREITEEFMKANVQYSHKGYISANDYYKWFRWFAEEQGKAKNAFTYGEADTCPGIRKEYEQRLQKAVIWLRNQKR